MRGPRAWVAATVVAASALTFCSAAYAEPPGSVPNSAVSHNRVATTSGILYYRKHGIHLGQDVRKFAPHGGQRDYVLGALQKTF